jgi:hypothetical protein
MDVLQCAVVLFMLLCMLKNGSHLLFFLNCWRDVCEYDVVPFLPMTHSSVM